MEKLILLFLLYFTMCMLHFVQVVEQERARD